MSEIVDLSQNAVYKHLVNLTEQGILHKIQAIINPNIVNLVMVLVKLQIGGLLSDNFLTNFSNNPYIRQVFAMTDNRIVIWADLRNISELDNFLADFIMPEIVNMEYHLVRDP